ncbi:hypothetical protein [Streptomyces sp. NPDC059442]|uniref:hypothetical protein n=1 Tax=unclassified Streptomyces TaxID=2593676 RepID=UPI0036A7601A
MTTADAANPEAAGGEDPAGAGTGPAAVLPAGAEPEGRGPEDRAEPAVDPAAEYVERCERLFLAGGRAAVRRTAQEGIDRIGPTADLYCWLGIGHADEDEDDHDDAAEAAFRAGLRLDPDHLGLLAAYTELCLRADAFCHPGRADRAVGLTARIKALAPESPQAERVEAAHRWHRRGYWEDIRLQAARAAVTSRAVEEQGADLAHALRKGGDPRLHAAAGAHAAAGPDGRRAAVLAATLEILSGPGQAPVRFLARYRTAAWVVSVMLSFVTNFTLRETGVVDSFSLWGWLWLVPMLLVDRRLATARRVAQQRAVARIEADSAA